MEYKEIKTLKKMVEVVLQNVPDTRNSDIGLMIEVWLRFYPNLVDNRGFVLINNLYELPREDNIKRIRAQFQNDKKLYLPTSWEIAERRGILEDEWRIAMGYPTKATTGDSTPSWMPPSKVKQGILLENN